jgi:hypothetical protein
MRKVCAIVFVVLLGGATLATPASAQSIHATGISKYDGAQTCLACHPEAAKEVAVSLHYQQQAEPQFLKDWPKGQMAGMMLSY